MSGIIAAVHRLTGWRHFPLIASLVLIASFMTGFYWREMVREAMCSPEKEHCFREWISATGGWIAVIFAYLTIRTMNRQTEEANRHQRENVELQIIDKLTIAKRVIGQATASSTLCVHLIAGIDNRLLERDFRNFNIYEEIAHIRKFIHVDEIRMVALTSGTTRHDPLIALDYAEQHLAEFNSQAITGRDQDAAVTLKTIRTFILLAKDALIAARYDANRFVDRWKCRFEND